MGSRNRDTPWQTAYALYLHSIPWLGSIDPATGHRTVKGLRWMALEIAGFRCAACGHHSPDGTGLQVHHPGYRWLRLVPDREGGWRMEDRTPVRQLIVCCKGNCHQAADTDRRRRVEARRKQGRVRTVARKRRDGERVTAGDLF